MANKSRKKRVSKKDESTLNRRIASGAVLTLLFVVLFFATWNAIQEEPAPAPTAAEFKEMTPQEQVAYVQEQEENLYDDVNYQRALTFSDRRYCEEISDLEMRAKCVSETPEWTGEERVQEPEKTEEQLYDDVNYQRALTFNDISYCEKIIVEELKAECISKISG